MLVNAAYFLVATVVQIKPVLPIIWSFLFFWPLHRKQSQRAKMKRSFILWRLLALVAFWRQTWYGRSRIQLLFTGACIYRKDG